MLLVPTEIFKELSKNIYKFRDKSRDLNSNDNSQTIYNAQELSMTALKESKRVSPVAISFSLFDKRYVLYSDGHVSEDVLSLSAFRNIDDGMKKILRKILTMIIYLMMVQCISLTAMRS